MDEKKYSYECVVVFEGNKSKKVEDNLMFFGDCSKDEIEDILSFVYETSTYHCNQYLPDLDVTWHISSFTYKLVK